MKKMWKVLCDCVEFIKMDFALKTRGYYVIKQKKTNSLKSEESPLPELVEYSNLITFSTAL